jgi:protein TonB
LEESAATQYRSPSEREIAFIQPRYAENPKPTYPQEARKKGYQGEVILKVEVLSNGRVGQVEVKRSSGHEILDRSAFAAVKEWRFVPAKKGENPIPFWVNIPIKFQLQ